MVDVPTGLEHITCPVLLLQGTNDPLLSMQTPRFLAFVRHAQMQWLPGLSHVPISDDPQLVASLMLRFLKTATKSGSSRRRPREGTRPKAATTVTIPGQLADHDADPHQSTAR
jgi:alpha-beta hydrolase superfamily lysophospholipase